MLDEQMLIDLKNLLLGWSIQPDDWYITGEAAMVLSDYPITFRDKQMDILVCRSVWPWEKPEEEVSLFPSKDSKEELEMKEFIKKHHITPDFHPLPHVGIKVEDRFEHSRIFSEVTGVRVLNPWAGIYHRKCMIEYYKYHSKIGLQAFDKNKFIRWKKFIEETLLFAKEHNDQKTVETCLETIPVVESAINFFDSNNDVIHNGEIFKGACAFAGKTQGVIQIWNDGENTNDKIIVLKAALPYQFAKLSKAKGIITDEGGLLSHAAIIAREYKIPTLIGVKEATTKLKNGDLVELDSQLGIARKIF